MTLTRSVPRIGCLSGNSLKIIATATMLIDHVGSLIFPQMLVLRVIGRLSMPIFAFLIAEGCRYTKNRRRYFLSVFLLAVLCQTVYYVYDGSTYLCILVTFSLSILMIFALQELRKSLLSTEASLTKKLFSGCLFAASVAITYFLNIRLTISYGFFGCMLPVFASLPVFPKENEPRTSKKRSVIFVCVLTMSVGLLFLSISFGGIQYFSFFAVPLLLLYSGERGKRNMKYFFYVFYPVHLLLLQAAALLFS